MSKSIKTRLLDILAEVEFLEKAFASKSREDLYADDILQHAASCALQNIGEAASKLPRDFCQKYPQVAWREMIGMRNRLAHNYTDTSYSLVHNTIKEDIPALGRQLCELLKEMPEE